jgi:hypothetical protein
MFHRRGFVGRLEIISMLAPSPSFKLWHSSYSAPLWLTSLTIPIQFHDAEWHQHKKQSPKEKQFGNSFVNKEVERKQMALISIANKLWHTRRENR